MCLLVWPVSRLMYSKPRSAENLSPTSPSKSFSQSHSTRNVSPLFIVPRASVGASQSPVLTSVTFICTPTLFLKAISTRPSSSINALSMFGSGAWNVVLSGTKFCGLNTPKYANAAIAAITTKIAHP